MYTIEEIAQIVPHLNKIINQPGLLIRHLLIDSRKLLFPESSLFFAFFGNQTDGHRYIEEVYTRGIRNFIIEDADFDTSPFPSGNFIIVQQSLKALQQLGSTHRQKHDVPVIGLTGSNGKTIIKEWIYQLLESQYKIVRSPGSYNSQIGVPLSIWQIEKDTDFALIEAGVSKKGEMEALSRIIAPTIGVFTNLGDAHASGFTSREEKLEEKLQLFRNSAIVLFDGDEKPVADIIRTKFPQKKLIWWSVMDPSAPLYISAIEMENKTSEIHYHWLGKEGKFGIPFKDPVSIRMAIFSVLTALVLGIEPSLIETGTSQLSAIQMRLETKDGVNNCLLINDSYNADITSFTQALLFLSQQDKTRKKVLILSDFFQIDNTPESLNRKLAALIDKQELSRILLVGTQLHSIQKYLNVMVPVHHFRNTAELVRRIEELHFQDEVILLKGARKFGFEEIFAKLSTRYHNTVLEINLDAITQNLQVYLSRLEADTLKLAVIKAAGYGAGSVKLARHLEKNNVDYFGVAFVDEGIELRKGGVTNPILVFNADLSFLEEMITYHLEPVVYSFPYLEQLTAEGPRGVGIHLKLDTGLNRLGFQENEWPALCEKLKRQSHFRVLSIYSHLSATPTRMHDAFTHQQAGLFNIGYDCICEALEYKPLKHLLNSAGVINFPEYQFDMVRIGFGIHGIDTSNTINQSLQVVHTLKARVSMIKKVKAGDSIGYERMGIDDKDRKIAIIPIGYADGLVRRAGNKRYSVWINGYTAPIIGNVNMDMSMVDVTGLPHVEIGDEVEIFGPNIPIQELAKAGETIFYEILTRISPRVKRIYIES